MAKKLKPTAKNQTTTKSKVSGTKSRKGTYYGYHPNSPEAEAIRNKKNKEQDAANKANYKKMSAAKKRGKA